MDDLNGKRTCFWRASAFGYGGFLLTLGGATSWLFRCAGCGGFHRSKVVVVVGGGKGGGFTGGGGDGGDGLFSFCLQLFHEGGGLQTALMASVCVNQPSVALTAEYSNDSDGIWMTCKANRPVLCGSLLALPLSSQLQSPAFFLRLYAQAFWRLVLLLLLLLLFRLLLLPSPASKYVELWLPVFYWSLLPAALQPFEHRCTKSGPQIDNRLVISQIDHPSVIQLKMMTRRLSRCQNMHSVARTLLTAVLDTAEVVR